MLLYSSHLGDGSSVPEGLIAQLVEHSIENAGVPGSSPGQAI